MAAQVEALNALVALPHSDHVALADGDVDVQPLAGEDVEHTPAREHEVRRDLAAGDLEPVRVDGAQPSVSCPRAGETRRMPDLAE
jgi:hypothetical protein